MGDLVCSRGGFERVLKEDKYERREIQKREEKERRKTIQKPRGQLTGSRVGERGVDFHLI